RPAPPSWSPRPAATSWGRDKGTSAADLKFLHRLRQTHFRNFKSKSGTRIINLLVPLCFRSSCQRVPQCITNFGSGALASDEHRDDRMRIHISHATQYHYDSAPSGVIQTLRLTPRNHDGQ